VAESSWIWDAGQLTLSVVVPPNATARVSLPGPHMETLEVGSGHYSWTVAYDISVALLRDPAARLDEVLTGEDMLEVLRALMEDSPPTTAARITANAMMRSSRERTLREIIASVPDGTALLERIAGGAS
jgi:alpha-L-rhamnosidase